GDLLRIQVDIQGALALFDRIFEYLDMPVEIQDAPHAVSLAPKETQGRLTFKNVTFTYKRDIPDVLQALVEKNGKNDPAQGKSSPPLPPISRSAVEQQSESGKSLEEVISRPALKNVSFDILPGQLAAL